MALYSGSSCTLMANHGRADDLVNFSLGYVTRLPALYLFAVALDALGWSNAGRLGGA